MAKRKKQKREQIVDPRRDLPQGPANLQGLRVRRIEQHRRGNAQAVRQQPWEGIGLDNEELAVCERYAELCARHRPSPAPPSCLDIAVGGYDDSEPTEQDARAEREWTATLREVRKAGVMAHVALDKVCYLQEPLNEREADALRVALQVLGDYWRAGSMA